MRKTRKPLSILMALALVAAMTVPAFAATQEGSINTPNTVTNPIFSIGVPKTMTLALDPLKLGSTGAQVVAGNFSIVNNSNVIAAIDVSVHTAVAAGVELVASPADPENDPSNVPNEAGVTDKIANLTIKYAVAANSGEEFVETTDTPMTVLYTDAKTQDLDTAGSKDFSVVLGAGKTNEGGKTASSSEVNGWTAFTFDGEINPNASWAAKDITITTVYKATSLSAEAAVASYTDEDSSGTAAPFDAADPAGNVDMGHQFFTETTWATAKRVYNFAKTKADGEIVVTDDTKTLLGANVKFTTDAAGKTATVADLFKYTAGTGTIGVDITKISSPKAGVITTYYIHALDGAGTDAKITATVPFYVYINN